LNLFERVFEAGRRHWDKEALKFEGGSLTYGELLGLADRVAMALEEGGFAGRVVALCSPNLPQSMAFALGAMRACSPVALLNPKDSPQNLALQIGLCGASLLASPLPMVGVAEAAGVGFVDLKGLLDGSMELPEPRCFDVRLPEGVAAVFFTSGSTGSQKPVMLSHEGIAFDAMASLELVEDLEEGDVMFNVLPMFHSFGFTVSFLLPLLGGMSQVVRPSFLPISETFDALRQATVLCGVPMMLGMLASEASRRGGFDGRLKLVISGGDKLPLELDGAFERGFGVPILEGYGLTEASPVVSVNPSYARRVLGSAGKPLPGVEVRISPCEGVDPSEGVGEVQVRGKNVMLGYLGMPEETRAAFSEDGWLRTKDLGFLDERGYLHLVDRASDLIIVGGFNVYPSEVERVLREHPSVQDVAVVGVEDPLRGQVVTAFVVPRGEADPAEMVRFCKGRLAPHKVPRKVVLVEELPRTAVGKVRRSALRSHRG